MGYTTPITWNSSLVTVAQMNEQIRDNLNALKDPPTDSYDVNEGADYTTTSTGFQNVDTTDLAMSITTTGGDIMVHFHGTVDNGSINTRVYFDLFSNTLGGRVGGDDGIVYIQMPTSTSGQGHSVSFTRLITGFGAGTHGFTLQWKVSGGTATMYAGAGTSNKDMHPQMWAREVS